METYAITPNLTIRYLWLCFSAEGRKLCEPRAAVRFSVQNQQHHDDHGRRFLVLGGVVVVPEHGQTDQVRFLLLRIPAIPSERIFFPQGPRPSIPPRLLIYICPVCPNISSKNLFPSVSSLAYPFFDFPLLSYVTFVFIDLLAAVPYTSRPQTLPPNLLSPITRAYSELSVHRHLSTYSDSPAVSATQRRLHYMYRREPTFFYIVPNKEIKIEMCHKI